MSQSRAEKSAYMREYRARNEAIRKADTLSERARQRAKQRLAEAFPDLYAKWVDEERVAVGLLPVGTVPKGAHKGTGKALV